MPWFAVDYDDTLVNQKTKQPEPGALEAMTYLVNNGHRVSIWTARFAFMPPDRIQVMRETVENELKQHGIPFTDIWTGPKPRADVFIGDNCVPYQGDWQSSLNQALMALAPQEPPAEPEMEPHGAENPPG